MLTAVLIGGLQHGLINLAHDAWHRLCYKNKRLNDLVGGRFYCYPPGMPYYNDRHRHWAHHRLVGRHEDPDRVNYRNEGRVPLGRLVIFLLGRLLGVQLFVTAYHAVFRREARITVESAATTRDMPSAMGEWARVAVCQLVIFGVFASVAPWWSYFVLWVWPIASFASMFIAIRAFAEHAAEDHAEVEDRLYDFSPNIIEAYFLSPNNFYYHALHHAYPNVPHYRLKLFRQALREHGHSYPGQDTGGYLSFLIREGWVGLTSRLSKKAPTHEHDSTERTGRQTVRNAS